ncbi:hypothetical protein C5X90_024845 [Klebsiella pneumoniae subsp. pneumoniae]|nr:hypothetical protein B9Z90_021825 [Klebsiella pneumoniae]RNY83057.1 hypothetical protein C5X90_024845 [Klebsiella pneumoniae subsp. pneumoniae]
MAEFSGVPAYPPGNGGKDGFAGRGIITAKAVTLFKSSLRCGASGALRLPCAPRIFLTAVAK